MLNDMAEIKRHEYALLDEIARDSLVTQANLSSRLGMAVGSVNWYLKRLTQRGWVKVSHLDRTRLKYDLTSEGMAVFTQRALSYARDSLKVYSRLREKAKVLTAELRQQGVQAVHLDGSDAAMDILRLTCIEAGLLLTDTPEFLVLRTNGQDYSVSNLGNE